MLKPNSGRVLVKPLFKEATLNSQDTIESQIVKAGEDLFVGRIVEPGDSKFKVGQVVYYSEYSAAMVFDMEKFVAGEQTLEEALKDKNIFVVVACDDVMAFQEQVPMSQAPLEVLAKELESFLDNPKYVEKKAIIRAIAANCRNESFSRTELITQLTNEGFRYFAGKLQNGYYDPVKV